MRAPLSWLRDFAPFPSDVAQLTDALDGLGLVVENVDRIGEGLDEIIVARVLRTWPHPDADRVQLVEVDAGGAEPVQVVCGAFNFAVDDLVPLAPVGARLPGGMEIGRRKVRGEWSNGMLCSGAELGLSDDHGGILVVSDGDGVRPGAALTDALALEPDVVFDLDVTPNRPDALSMVGVARDLAAKLQLPFSLLEVPPVDHGPSPAGVTLKARDLCPRFTALVLEGVRIAPSPRWLTRRVTLAGMRSINNVVDVSNYVMLELGHPNHPYDLTRLGGGGLLIRKAKKGETVTTLDGVERAVTPEDCLICDATGAPVGIGGVMGGASAEISDSTSTVLLETAYFDREAIARTSKRIGLRTEASVRFERGTDPEDLDRAAARFAALAADVAGARVAGGLVDVHGRLPKRPRPLVRTARVNALLGTQLSVDEIAGYLRPIGFETGPARGGLRVTIPSWRPDSTEEVDVIEEVGRHHGYERIERTVPTVLQVGRLTTRQRDRRQLRALLVGSGLSEAWTTSFLAPEDLRRAGLAVDAVEVENPLAHEESLLRPSLLPGLLRAVAVNASHRNPGVRLFETGVVFLPLSGERPTELEQLAIVLAQQDAAAAKHLWDLLRSGLAVSDARLSPALVAGLHPTRTMQIDVQGRMAGAVGEVDPSVLAAHDIEGGVGWLQLDLEQLFGAVNRSPEYRPVSRYPSSDIDLAFVVPDEVIAGDVERTLRETAGAALADLRLFDVFRGDQLGPGVRSLAYHLRFEAADHTLTDAETAEIRRRCIEAVERTHSARLRG